MQKSNPPYSAQAQPLDPLVSMLFRLKLRVLSALAQVFLDGVSFAEPASLAFGMVVSNALGMQS